MPLPTGVIVVIVRRRHLDTAGAKRRVHEQAVRDDRNLTAVERDGDGFADQVLIARIVGMDGDRGIAEHGFRPGGREADRLLRSGG